MQKARIPALLFLLPAAVIFLIFFYWPLAQNLYLSFFQWNMVSPQMKFVGIANYLEVLGSMELLKNLGNTLMFIIVLLILNFLLQ